MLQNGISDNLARETELQVMNIKNKFTMQEVEDFWDSVANIYEDCNTKVSDVHNQRFTESIKYLTLKENSKILNIWSRTGTANKFLRIRKKKLDIFNAELSSKMIKIAKKNFPSEKFDKVDLVNLPYPDEYFDEILSLETIEHVQVPLKYIKELYRVLKPGGRLVLSAPPATAEFALKCYEMFFENHGEGPHKFLSSKTVKMLLRKADLKIIRHKGTLLFPVSNNPLRTLGESIINAFQDTFISELGIRQFYIAEKR